MQVPRADVDSPPADTSRAALDLIHRLLSDPEVGSHDLGEVLGELAAAFDAAGAGLVALADGGVLARHPGGDALPASGRWPWEESPDLVSRARQAVAGVTVERSAGGTYLLAALLAPVGPGWLLWLEDPSRTAWTEAEAGALALAGQTLARHLLAGSSSRWVGQLERADRQQRLEHTAQVVRRLAHDFGNVLTGILGFSELALSQQIPSGSSLHSYLAEVHRGAQGGALLTQQLRLFSRRQAGNPRPSSLPIVLAEEETRLRSLGNAVHLRIHLPPDLPPVALDADNLQQVLSALLGNAYEAIVGPGAVSVSAGLVELDEADCRELYGDVRPGPHVEVTIADTGTGLSPEAQRQLFAEPFYSTKARRRGFGLGTAYGILHAHRGGLRLYPGAERGAVARVLLPVAVALAPAPTLAPTPVEMTRGERVLVVDDDPMILQFVATTLERAGYRVQATPNAEDALRSYAAATADPFRLVLSDVIMPRVTGVDLARRLLARDAGVRVLFMSGQVSGDFVQHEPAIHQFDLLAKPFRPEGLLRAVRLALDRPPARRSASPVRGG